MITSGTVSSGILESGTIHFIYRPRVNHPLVRGLEDVQRLYVFLLPSEGGYARRLVLGRKQLPRTRPSRQRFWSAIDAVGSAEDLTADLSAETYFTRTLGERHQPAARPAGSGTYALSWHEGHSHLSHRLALPEHPGEVQRALQLPQEASFLVAVFNPEWPRRQARNIRPVFPSSLQARFGDRRFAAVDTPALLDWAGVELVLIGSGHPPPPQDRERLGESGQLEAERVFDQLRLPFTPGLVRPLQTGEWS